MAEPHFKLRSPKSKKDQPISLVLRYKDIKLVYPTGHKINPKYWNKTEQRVRNIAEFPEKDSINATISNLTSAADLALSELISERAVITKEVLRSRIEKHLKPNEPEEESASKVITLYSFIEDYIEQSKTRLNPTTGKLIDKSTIKEYERTLARLKEFEDLYNIKVDFDHIDLDFYYEFVDYLTNIRQYALNTVGKYIKKLKEFLNVATERGKNNKLDFRSHRFKTLTEDTDKIYLTDKELQKIHEYDFSDNPRLDNARDLFLVGALTGLRFSDFSRLDLDNFYDNEFIKIEQKKSNGKVVIPLHPTLQAILKKRNGNLPHAISNQNLNDYIKEVCGEVGLNSSVSISITKAGVRQTETYKKYELVTTHTARRSFATNLYKSGFPAISIMQITGHRTEKAFLRYIRLSAEEHAELLQKHWNLHFNQN